MAIDHLDSHRFGFIGFGRHARANLYPSIEESGINLWRIATRSKETAELAARRAGVAHSHDSVDSLLQAGDLDAVFISVAPEDQSTLTLQCLNAGLHVFVEKPLGMTAAEAALVADAADAANRIVMVGFMKRFAPAYTELSRLISNTDQFGRVVAIDGYFGFTPWTNELREESYLKLGAIHLIDLYRSLLGEVASVSGNNNSVAAEISTQFSFVFDSGVIGSLSLYGLAALGKEHERITVTGTNGWAEVNGLDQLTVHYSNPSNLQRWQTLDEQTTTIRSVNSPLSGGLRDLYHRGFVGEVQHFLAAVASGGSVTPSARDNLATMQLCDQMLAAISDEK